MSQSSDRVEEISSATKVAELDPAGIRSSPPAPSRTMTSPPPRPRTWMRNTRRRRPSSLPARLR